MNFESILQRKVLESALYSQNQREAARWIPISALRFVVYLSGSIVTLSLSFQQPRQLHQLFKPCAPFVRVGDEGFAVADFVGAAGGEIVVVGSFVFRLNSLSSIELAETSVEGS